MTRRRSYSFREYLNSKTLTMTVLGFSSGLPFVLVGNTFGYWLRDEGIAYAEKLHTAGVQVTHLHYPDMHHNFPVHPGTVARFPQSIEALNQFADWLKRTLK